MKEKLQNTWKISPKNEKENLILEKNKKEKNGSENCKGRPMKTMPQREKKRKKRKRTNEDWRKLKGQICKRKA